jgi:hypothetical protein
MHRRSLLSAACALACGLTASLVDAASRFAVGVGRRTPRLKAIRMPVATERWIPVAPRLDLGGSPVLHGVEPDEVPVFLRHDRAKGHMLVCGRTHAGKTRLLGLAAGQDVVSSANGPKAWSSYEAVDKSGMASGKPGEAR